MLIFGRELPWRTGLISWPRSSQDNRQRLTTTLRLQMDRQTPLSAPGIAIIRPSIIPMISRRLGLASVCRYAFSIGNQGEKHRTLIDIDRNQRLEDAANAQVFSDVDTAYAQVNSNIIIVAAIQEQVSGPRRSESRETVTFSWQRGAASLMDFLNAQSDYRQIQMAYVQLIGSYLTAAGQLNLAVGVESDPLGIQI